MTKKDSLPEGVLNILGEVLWHSATSDASIVQVSEEHMYKLLDFANEYLSSRSSPRFLEVAAYAHITGYLLAKQFGWVSTLTDISVETLALGQSHAKKLGLDTSSVRRVAADFHDLPFNDREFDIVYISSALHHTLRWQTVLSELFRVTNDGGIIILQNEPCQRQFCLYKFPTNRPESFRDPEIELDRLGILKTIAEPYPGSRPESLFGMIENQNMPLEDIRMILYENGTIESLEIDSSICLSPLDREILSAPRHEAALARKISNELNHRIRSVHNTMTPTDIALGIALPSDQEIVELSARTATSLVALPTAKGLDYDCAVASIFGGSITAVTRRIAANSVSTHSVGLRYCNGERKGVTLGFPPALNSIVNGAIDLVPDIQTAKQEEISSHFPANQWSLGSNSDLRYLVLSAKVGQIIINRPDRIGCFVVLLRAYGAPTKGAFRLGLCVDGIEVAGVDVHQPDSFLLRAEFLGGETMPTISLLTSPLDCNYAEGPPPVTLAAVRVVAIGQD